MKSIFYLFYICVVFCFVGCNPGFLDLSKSANLQATQEANKLHQSTLIVRVPSQGNKIRFLKSAITNPKTTSSNVVKYKKLLDETMTENKDHYDILIQGFKTNYTFSAVLFMPDSLYKSFIRGNRNVFLNESNEIDNQMICECKNYFFISHEKNNDVLVLKNSDDQKLLSPFPYKKNTFLPSFKRLFDQEKYIHNQIKWFDEQLNYLFIQYKA
jgi:hypothetical protein